MALDTISRTIKREQGNRGKEEEEKENKMRGKERKEGRNASLEDSSVGKNTWYASPVI